MALKLHLGRFLVCGLLFALPVFAQLDSAALRAKYGAPLNRETFRMPPGFDLVVDYGANLQVCKLEVPALMPTSENPSNTSVMRQRMYDFLADLVPDSMRGKELNRFVSVMGAMSVLSNEYQHMTIAELQDANALSHNTITIRFKDSDCQNPAGQ